MNTCQVIGWFAVGFIACFILIFVPETCRHLWGLYGWQLLAWFQRNRNVLLHRAFALAFFIGFWLFSWVLSFVLRP